MIKKIIGFIFCVITGIALHSQVAAVACIKSNTEAGNSAELVSYFENALLDRFFDSGFVITEIPLSTGGKEIYEGIFEMKKAFEAVPDYLIVSYFSFGNGKKYYGAGRKFYPEWESVSWKVVKLNSEKILYEKDVPIENIKGNEYLKKMEALAAEVYEKAVKEIRRSK